MTKQDLQYVRKARKAGARYAYRIVKAARLEGVPLRVAFAVVEQESEFKNVFGCDGGSILCHESVTRARVQRLRDHIRRGGISNGVGLTQLTYPGFIEEAERRGGAHLPYNQLVIGFKVIRDLLREHGQEGLWRYNGAPAYQHQLDPKIEKWHAILTR